ncbi:hypothetical protein AN958_09261 [Leucoagaricus sp. SymC.cos]|nr:hypothetical protein AN958_09261 [Leucoagaricus sp. SymC.cos]
MMLVHKQPPLHLSQQLNPALTHRRHPSAPPTVIVQPTRIPGLLSLSKPTTKASPQRQLNPAQRPQQQKSPKPRQQQPARHALLNAAEITDKKTAVRPNKKQAKPSNTVKQTSPRHGKHCRTSPPISDPSQAEDASDPFLDFSPSTAFKPNTPRPNNKRRSHNPLTIQTPSKAIPVPSVPRRSANQHLSRSEPTVSHSWEHVCDDSNDESPFTPPTTPLRARPAFAAPFSGPVHGTPKRKFRNHKRTPSDHIFAMSSDDEAPSSGQEDLRALLDFVRSGSRPASSTTPPPHRTANPDYVRTLSPASREKFFELEAQKEVAGYFASSSFQNSPSPDDLPDPLFA